MTLIEKYRTIVESDGSRKVRCMITSDTTPSPMPTNGADVEGLEERDTFLPMSYLYCDDTDTLYHTNEQGEWTE